VSVNHEARDAVLRCGKIDVNGDPWNWPFDERIERVEKKESVSEEVVDHLGRHCGEMTYCLERKLEGDLC